MITSDLQSAKNAIDGLIENIKFKTGCDEYELWLTGGDNFRYKVVDDYKHNRLNSRKPTDFGKLWEYLIEHHGANVSYGYEADDMVVYLKTKYPDDYFLCAIDKDVLYQTEGSHYNYGTDEIVEVDYNYTIRFFYYQILKGDPTDGYGGCKGIGEVKANKILNDAEQLAKDERIPLTEAYYGRVVATYMSAYACSEEEAEAMIQNTARLACMHQLEADSNGDIKVRLWYWDEMNFGVIWKPLF